MRLIVLFSLAFNGLWAVGHPASNSTSNTLAGHTMAGPLALAKRAERTSALPAVAMASKSSVVDVPFGVKIKDNLDRYSYVRDVANYSIGLENLNFGSFQELFDLQFPRQFELNDFKILSESMVCAYKLLDIAPWNNYGPAKKTLNKIHQLNALFNIEKSLSHYMEFKKFKRDLAKYSATNSPNLSQLMLLDTTHEIGCRGEISSEAFLADYPAMKEAASCTGKIFAVYDGEVEFTGSGCVAIAADGKKYILTCKHNFKIKPEERLEDYTFYFVPTAKLNPDTGRPLEHGVAEDCVKFLSTLSEDVVKINSAALYDYNTSNSITPEQLQDNEGFRDSVVKHSLSIEQLQYINGISISAENLDIDRYFAIGYPLNSYLSLESIDAPLPEEQVMNRTPFTITSSINEFKVVGKGVQHFAPTAQGMSGGAVLGIDNKNNKAVLLGIILNGEWDENYMLRVK